MKSVDDQTEPHHRKRWAVFFVALAVALLMAAGYATTRHTSEDSQAGSPQEKVKFPRHEPLGSGTIDGVPWKVSAWYEGDSLCMYFVAGASVSACRSENWSAVPFVYVYESPVTDGKRGATTTVITGALDPFSTAVRVVEPHASNAVADLIRCPCPALDRTVAIFTIPVTRSQTSVDDMGRYVVVAAFHEGTELGRVRVALGNFGYCGTDECK